jgi:hypothetical protein
MGKNSRECTSDGQGKLLKKVIFEKRPKGASYRARESDGTESGTLWDVV